MKNTIVPSLVCLPDGMEPSFNESKLVGFCKVITAFSASSVVIIVTSEDRRAKGLGINTKYWPDSHIIMKEGWIYSLNKLVI